MAERIYGLIIIAVTASGMLTQSIGQTAADPLLSRSGLYEVISRLELPHLERWAIDKKTWVCLFSRVESHAIPLPVLSKRQQPLCIMLSVKFHNACRYIPVRHSLPRSWCRQSSCNL